MDVLIVFENDFNCENLLEKLKDKQVTIHLFPLTSNYIIIERVQQNFKALPNARVNLVKSAMLINQEVVNMQSNILRWSNQLGEVQISKRSIKEWLTLPDQGGSAWWFSILSEKNAVQETIIFQIARINAIKSYLEDHPFDKCYLAIANKQLNKILKSLLKRLDITKRSIKVSSDHRGIKAKIFDSIANLGFLGALIAAAINFLQWSRQSIYARSRFRSVANDEKSNLLFISYFPNIDNEAAKKGIFKNKYALALQDKMSELNQPITWLLMPVYYNGHNFKSAVNLARRFIESGERIFILQQFFNFKVFTKAFVWWLRQASIGIYLFWKIDKNILTNNLTVPESVPILKYLWWHSFVGASSVRGIIFYLTYCEVFRKIPNINNCIYYCEMQAWEKACVLAKKKIASHITTLAFQHTVVARNYYNYFYDRNDTQQRHSILDFPAPDVLIANGERTYELLAESKFPKLVQAEAIRQLYLNNARSTPKSVTDKPILFVGGSCDRIEMKSLISMLYTAFPAPLHFEVWIKASPVNPVEPIFKDLKIDIAHTGYKIYHNEVADLLKSATVALIANTTVALEAAANDCPVIVPVLADTMLMNPIVETSATYFQITNVEELKEMVEKLLFDMKEKTSDVNMNFIQKYWNINPDLPLWSNLLNQILYAAHPIK